MRTIAGASYPICLILSLFLFARWSGGVKTQKLPTHILRIVLFSIPSHTTCESSDPQRRSSSCFCNCECFDIRAEREISSLHQARLFSTFFLPIQTNLSTLNICLCPLHIDTNCWFSSGERTSEFVHSNPRLIRIISLLQWRWVKEPTDEYAYSIPRP